MEQKDVVAAPAQLLAIGGPPLPRSNQTEATLFDEGRNDTNGELLMKRLLLGAVAMIVFAAPAAAADLQARPRPYTKAPAYTAPEVVYNWTGFYIGGHLGGAFAGNNSLEGNGGRFLGGVQGGFDYQFAPNWVVGAEAQYSWLANNNNNGVLFPGGTLVTNNNDQLGSVTGRRCSTPTAVTRSATTTISASLSPASRSRLPPMGDTRTATPSVAVSNTCSHPTGPPRRNTSITTSAAPHSRPGPPT